MSKATMSDLVEAVDRLAFTMGRLADVIIKANVLKDKPEDLSDVAKGFVKRSSLSLVPAKRDYLERLHRWMAEFTPQVSHADVAVRFIQNVESIKNDSEADYNIDYEARSWVQSYASRVPIDSREYRELVHIIEGVVKT